MAYVVEGMILGSSSGSGAGRMEPGVEVEVGVEGMPQQEEARMWMLSFA